MDRVGVVNGAMLMEMTFVDVCCLVCYVCVCLCYL